MNNNKTTLNTALHFLLVFAFIVTFAGCATAPRDPRDPIEPFNRGVYKFNKTLDEYLMQPIARGYRFITPAFVDRGVTNFFNNIDDISVIINDLLQLKLEQSSLDATRFLINSTIGVAGLFDVASKWELYKHEEDFDQTLGVWGLPTGPYLVLPLFGPSSPRGAVGLAGDAVMNPVTYASDDTIRSGLYALDTIDFRADNLSATQIVEEAAIDEYEFIRNAYFQRRRYLVHDGAPPLDEEFEDLLEEDLLEEEEEPEGMSPIPGPVPQEGL